MIYTSSHFLCLQFVISVSTNSTPQVSTISTLGAPTQQYCDFLHLPLEWQRLDMCLQTLTLVWKDQLVWLPVCAFFIHPGQVLEVLLVWNGYHAQKCNLFRSNYCSPAKDSRQDHELEAFYFYRVVPLLFMTAQGVPSKAQLQAAKADEASKQHELCRTSVFRERQMRWLLQTRLGGGKPQMLL